MLKGYIYYSLSKIVDYSIYLPNYKKEIRVGAITPRIDALTIVDILYLGVAKNNLKKTKGYIKNTREVISRIK